MPDEIDNVSHYDSDACMRTIEKLNLNFRLGSVLKYLWRAGRKHDRIVEDLKKARWYLDREIQALEGKLP